MKELSIEQKAQAYDKALEIISDYYQKIEYSSLSNASTDREVLEKAFPQLKEGEDERIRKELLDFCKNKAENFPNDPKYKNISAWIAWLEKQGQKPQGKSALDAAQEEKVDNQNCVKPTDIVEPKIENEIEIPFGAKYSELQEATYYIPKGFHAEINDDKVVIKKGEKSIAWSEEDETKIKSIIALIKSSALCAMDGNKGIIDESIKYLKSLKERVLPQSKQGWSKEDENNILFLTSIIEECFKDKEEITLYGDTVCANFTKEDVINRLKSLRPQNTWKPNDEQMKALNNIIVNGHMFYSRQERELMNLYNDLKNLIKK